MSDENKVEINVNGQPYNVGEAANAVGFLVGNNFSYKDPISISARNSAGAITGMATDVLEFSGLVPFRVQTNQGDDIVSVEISDIRKFQKNVSHIDMGAGQDILKLKVAEGLTVKIEDSQAQLSLPNISVGDGVAERKYKTISISDKDGVLKKIQISGVEGIEISDISQKPASAEASLLPYIAKNDLTESQQR